MNRTLVRDARSNHVPRCIGAASGSRCARPNTSTARSPVAVTTPRAAPGMDAGPPGRRHLSRRQGFRRHHGGNSVWQHYGVASYTSRGRWNLPVDSGRRLIVWMHRLGIPMQLRVRAPIPSILRFWRSTWWPVHRIQPAADRGSRARSHSEQEFIAQSGHSPPFARMPYEQFSRAEAVAIADAGMAPVRPACG